MSVAGEDESSYCVDVDEDEPTNKVARSHERSSSDMPGKCENVISKSFLDIKSTEHNTYTSELWNGLDTKRSNESRSTSRTKEEKKKILESTTIKVEPIDMHHLFTSISKTLNIHVLFLVGLIREEIKSITVFKLKVSNK